MFDERLDTVIEQSCEQAEESRLIQPHKDDDSEVISNIIKIMNFRDFLCSDQNS